MTLLDRYMARRFLFTLVQVAVALVLIYCLVDLLTDKRREIEKHEVPPLAVLQYYLYLAPGVLFRLQAFGLSVLIAALLVLGRAAQRNEITAALAAGLSLRRATAAPLVIGLVLAVAGFFVNDSLGVAAAQRAQDIFAQYFEPLAMRERPAISWTNLGEDRAWTCHILKFNEVALTGEDVYLHALGESREQEIQANRIFWSPAAAAWLLEDGYWAIYDGEQNWRQEVLTFSQRPAPFSEGPAQLFALEAPPHTRRAAELRDDLIQAEALGRPAARHWVHYHAKFAHAALPFVMVVLAVPFAVRLRRGGLSLGLGLGIAIGLAYLLTSFVGMGLGQLGQLPPVVAAWLGNLVFAVAGVWLFARAPS